MTNLKKNEDVRTNKQQKLNIALIKKYFFDCQSKFEICKKSSDIFLY